MYKKAQYSMAVPIQNLIAIYSRHHSIDSSAQIQQKCAHQILCVGGCVHSCQILVSCVGEARTFSYYKEKLAVVSVAIRVSSSIRGGAVLLSFYHPLTNRSGKVCCIMLPQVYMLLTARLPGGNPEHSKFQWKYITTDASRSLWCASSLKTRCKRQKNQNYLQFPIYFSSPCDRKKKIPLGSQLVVDQKLLKQ